MDQKAIIKFCKELGCCDACCFRYLGLKNPKVYENPKNSILKYEDQTADNGTEELLPDTKIKTELGETPSISEIKPSENPPIYNSSDIDDKTLESANIKQENDLKVSENVSKTQEIGTGPSENGESQTNGDQPPPKRQKTEICISCLGVLQEKCWPECFEMVKEQLDKKRYECSTFACALSAPICTLVREKAIALMIQEKYDSYDPNIVTPLKEAWKWSFGFALSSKVDKTLDSGAVSPLLLTLTIEYPDDLQELEILKKLAPSLFASRKQQKRRFTVEFTRRFAEQALDGATLLTLRAAGWARVPAAGCAVKCVSVMCTHAPVYLGGRYIKLSRSLPQTPWLVNGQRMMPSSVQEIIFEHIARLYDMSEQEAEHRLKFMSAGREDVDVRCLGEGRPFAVEIADPRRSLTAEELARTCDVIAQSGQVRVTKLVHVTREDLALLKKGEESKTKTYEALCIKLTHSEYDEDKSGPPEVTDRDISNINNYSNATGDARIVLSQKTPLRVLHRRPLLTRTRRIYELQADKVAGHPQLFVVRARTEAGTYLKEWVHGELGRSRPALGAALRARVDILALDVTSVQLDWPNT